MNNLPILFPTTISASSLEDLNKCQMYFFRKHIQHLYSRAPNVDLLAGGQVAKACELIRNAFFNDGLSHADAVEVGVEYILSAEDTGGVIKSNENVAFCVKKYFQTFRPDELPACLLADGTHAVEYRFEFDLGIPHPDLPDTNLKFTGRLDYLCEKVELTRTSRYVLDEKTCSSISRLPGSKTIDYAREVAQYRTYGPLLAYHWAARELGVHTTSSLIRRIPIMKEYEPAYQLEIPVTQWQIDSWYKGTYNLLLDMVEKYKSYKRNFPGTKRSPAELFYMSNTNTACMSYGKPCVYAEGCMSKEGELLLAEKYSQRVYDRDIRQEMLLEDYLRGLIKT
jgi:hypothetical protein